LLFSLAAAIVGGVAFVALGAVLSAIDRSEVTEIVNVMVGVGFYVAMMLGYSTIYQGTVKLALWRVGMESIELEGLAALDAVKAAGVPSSAVGEGLADALNVGGF
jgi:vacuolar-type H+-ATPase subunit I/STV1